MFKTRFKISINLSIIIAVLATIASAGGLLIKDLYRDNALIKTAWYGNDLVTIFTAVPLMIIALVLSMRGSLKAQLVWMGTLWYMVYNYIFYMYGSAFNNFFLIYVIIFTLSTYALIFALIKVEPKTIAEKFGSRVPVKWISGYLVFFGLLLGSLWTASSLSFVFTGMVPHDVVKTGTHTSVVYATDLSLLVPALLFSAYLLWKREAWGYVLSVIVLIKSITYSLVLLVMSTITYFKLGEGDPFIVLWVILSLCCCVCLGLLLGNMKSSD